MKKLFFVLACLSLFSCGPQKVLSVLSYNVVTEAQNQDDIREYEDIAYLVNYEQPDIVALQEIDFESGRDDGIDAMTVFKSISDKESGFTRNITLNEKSKGVGILTFNHPLTTSSILLPGETGDPIALIHEYSDCVVVSVQFPYDEKSQLESVAIMDSIATIFTPSRKPIIIAGTMPFSYGSAPFERMSQNFGLLSDSKAPTFLTHLFSKPVNICFDYIWAYTGSGINYYVWRSDVIDPTRQSSLHRPIIVTFKYTLPKKTR